MASTKVMSSMLEVRGLSKSYDSSEILNRVELAIAHGKTLAIIGRSGSGKTTLLKCLSLITPPDTGDLVLDGQMYVSDGTLVFEPWEVRRQVVLVFQEFNLFPNMTVGGNITFALEKIRGMRKEEARERAFFWATRLGIESILDRYPQTISGGQAQRCALARAIVLQPKVLLLDEITSALDPDSVAGVVEAIRVLREADECRNMAILIVTHLMRFAQEFADDVAFMHAGTIWERLPAKEFFDHCSLAETRDFVSSTRNPLAEN